MPIGSHVFSRDARMDAMWWAMWPPALLHSHEGLTRGVATAKFLMLGEICPTGKLWMLMKFSIIVWRDLPCGQIVSFGKVFNPSFFIYVFNPSFLKRYFLILLTPHCPRECVLPVMDVNVCPLQIYIHIYPVNLYFPLRLWMCTCY